MKMTEDFELDSEFDALLNATLQQRLAAPVPDGLAQRLLARLAQAAEAEQRKRAAVQFRDFGVLNDGANSKGAFLGSALFNCALVALAILVGSAIKTAVQPQPVKLTDVIVPLKDTPKPPPIERTAPPKPPEPPLLHTPEIKPKDIELPPEVKPVVVETPHVNLAPPAPARVDPPPAPHVVNLANASAASVANHDARPSPVRLGHPDSPVSPTGPAVSSVNLSSGMPGMSAGNRGNGPASKSVNLGNGSPNGTNTRGRDAAPKPVLGSVTGIAGGESKGLKGPVRIEIAPLAGPVNLTPHPPTTTSPLAKPPVVTSIPKPVYSAEARQLHLEGDAQVKVNLRANGTVQVMGLSHGLGHGLDEAALSAAQGIHFKPATDASGHAIDFQTTVTVHFLLN